MHELQSRLSESSSNLAELPLIQTAVYLGQQMLCDQAVTFPMLYHHYLSITKANDVPALPRYQVLVYVGKEFGDLMSSVSHRNSVGRIFYRTKCDPFLMLSHALGTAKSKPQVGHARGHVCEEVAGYLNEKVHELSSQLIAEREQGPVVANTFNLECAP